MAGVVARPTAKELAELVKKGQQWLTVENERYINALDRWVLLEAQWRAIPGNGDACPVGGCSADAAVICGACAKKEVGFATREARD